MINDINLVYFVLDSRQLVITRSEIYDNIVIVIVSIDLASSTFPVKIIMHRMCFWLLGYQLVCI